MRPAGLLAMGLLGLAGCPSNNVRTGTPPAGTATAVASGTASAVPLAANTAMPKPPVPTRAAEAPSDMVLVPAGEFVMGCQERPGCATNEPSHAVFLDAFFIDRTEVTGSAYAACVDAGMCKVPASSHAPDTTKYCNFASPGRGNHPVNCLDWQRANAFCRWAGKRLPTEAEWEKAAAGTEGRDYPWGDALPSCSTAVMLVNLDSSLASTGEPDGGCGRKSTWPVASKPEGASPYGAFDMAGNVAEWVADWYDAEYYAASPRDNPKGPASGEDRITRGGAFKNDRAWLATFSRMPRHPASLSYLNGVRCARDAATDSR